jgi:hypothetical protein
MSIDNKAVLLRILAPPDADFHAEIQRADAEGWVTPEFLTFLEKGASAEAEDPNWPRAYFTIVLGGLRDPENKEAHDAVSGILARGMKGQEDGARINNRALLTRLLLPADGNVQAEIRRMDQQGWLTPEFRRFLEKGAVGEIETNESCPPSLFTWLLGEVLDVRFIPPDTPPRLKALYEIRIRQTLEPPSLEAVRSLLGEMEREGLFNRHFLEFFGNELNTHRVAIGRSMADSIWEMVTDRAATVLQADGGATE